MVIIPIWGRCRYEYILKDRLVELESDSSLEIYSAGRRCPRTYSGLQEAREERHRNPALPRLSRKQAHDRFYDNSLLLLPFQLHRVSFRQTGVRILREKALERRSRVIHENLADHILFQSLRFDGGQDSLEEIEVQLHNRFPPPIRGGFHLLFQYQRPSRESTIELTESRSQLLLASVARYRRDKPAYKAYLLRDRQQALAPVQHCDRVRYVR